MSSTVMVAARMEPELKERARAVLERDGLTESQLIRRVYEYVVYLGRVPDFIKTGEFDMVIPVEGGDKFDELLFLLENNPFNSFDFTALGDMNLKEAKAEALEAKYGGGEGVE